MIKDTMERDMINEISTLFVMIFTSGLMFVMPILDIGYNDIIVIIGFGIILSFILTIIPILLSYDIRDGLNTIKPLPFQPLLLTVPPCFNTSIASPKHITDESSALSYVFSKMSCLQG